MDTPRAFVNPHRYGAGIISKISLENFMCHSSLQIDLGEHVNFITGQNGSGKSAILTALCVAFGIRAKNTQRASSVKEFIKTGCNYALVVVEMKNQGEDAFKHDTYGNVISIERRITVSSSTTVLKDCRGKKVAHKKGELHELVEHFNIDVENPCVIMSQDKSREFLHSGNDKDKFKFFFRATLLQQVNELLQNIKGQLDAANAMIDELESSIRPILKEIDELKEKIKSMEHVEEISQQVNILKKQLAWCWVYDVDHQIQEEGVRLEKLKDRIPTCQARIDRQKEKIDELKGLFLERKGDISNMMEKTSEVRRLQGERQQNLSKATKEKFELEEEMARRTNMIRKLLDSVKRIEQQILDVRDKHVRDTQAEKSEMQEQLAKLHEEFDIATSRLQGFKEEEDMLDEKLRDATSAVEEISAEIQEYQTKYREINAHIRDLQRQKTNKVTAFGGERVLHLLRVIEMHYRKFKKPPIGPIGAHVSLKKDDSWALAIEHAIGKLLNSFVVTDHKDSLLLRECAREANYPNLHIFIYDFDRPLLNIPSHMLPNTKHPTTISAIHTDIATIFNVLIDQGSAERQVLVRDYETGKSVAFDQRVANIKEVLTSEGHRMFYRGSVQTTLPPNKRLRSGRLCSSVDHQIKWFENEASKMRDFIQRDEGQKRGAEKMSQDVQHDLHSIKKRRLNTERNLVSIQHTMRDLKDSYNVDAAADLEPNVDELQQEILRVRDEVQQKEMSLEELRIRVNEAERKANDCKLSFDNICESAKVEMEAVAEAEHTLVSIEDALHSAEKEKAHYEDVMQRKVIYDIKEQEELCKDLQRQHEESCKKASIICLESEVEALGGCAGNTPEQLSAQINRLNKRLQHESQRHHESIDDLRKMLQKKEMKILKKQQTYATFHEKLDACQKALELRWKKFQRNATLLKRQLTWQFNGHLRRKGISGQIKVDYEMKTLSVEVKMPQDASSITVRDTRGLSGGERSFSTLCFALALHEMTEAPFRAMDEFDVFMDAISRKISLDTLVEFAVTQGSQWIFITPHDISMVKPNERVRKQQMAAPRG
ncbi:structural maintenance of chromosomes protein 6B isoform X1 [Amborella trichopoda]|uniref:structural maintenance of chromosomes protein 6B isoform X1 n=1 Tax=Amborella trichopoda TaxID=13333 RepID=UPI0005D3DA6E|nr:structural maintenance of chromosomes protein 6B isoform X1 [Amborella trichopoda]|eukprot:XP_011621369.1 structural maintenance of chromosomes protein 6B isoform X1 [Amborella trichopoda]